MKRFFILVLALTSQCLLTAYGQRMTVRERDGTLKLLQVEQAAVSVSFLGDIAETVLDLNFRNDGERAVEGEFVMPLPEGATVSGYALDVNGKMREGVAVEKERARNAYESVKRRMIDPGIVEREAGNIYRTQVYPVPARGTKRLRIRYNETLRTGARGLDYSLPLDFPAPLVSFTCGITRAGAGEILVTDASGLEFSTGTSSGLKAEVKNGKPAGTLKISLTIPPGPRMIVEDEPEPAFLLSDVVPEIPTRVRPDPATVMLVWDASGSGLNRDYKKELAILDAWFAKLGQTRVKLRLLRDRLEDGGEFQVVNGGWPELKRALQQVDYDGATALSELRVPAGEADIVVLFSDGISTLGDGRPEVATPWVSFRTGPDLTELTKLTHQPLRLMSVTGEALQSFIPQEQVEPGKPIRIHGTLKNPASGKIELRYGFDNEVVSTREVSYQAGGNLRGGVRRIHSQRVLAGLEKEDRPNRQRIIDHCKRHGLVSDFTSFIVLELLQDYADHQIVPPEPELHEAYLELVKQRGSQRLNDHGGFRHAWTRKIEWFERRFPGYEVLILPRVRQVGIWKKAMEAQFAPAQRDAGSFATIAGWFDRAAGLIAEKPRLRSRGDYDQWRAAIDELHAQGAALAGTPLQPPPAGQPIAVSVRGLVEEPGVITRDAPISLREAVGIGGLHSLGSLDNVALYRNAGKIVYNTLSEQFQDVPMFPGDMVVVGQKHFDFRDRYADPFSGESDRSDPADPRKEGPVRSEEDLWVAPSTDWTPRDSHTLSTSAGVELNEAPDLAPFREALKSGVDPEAAYRDFKSRKIYQDSHYVEAARILFRRQQPDLARRVLSNNVESRPGDSSAVRAHAFWLAEFGRQEEAVVVLNQLLVDDPAAIPPRLDLASIHATQGNPAEAVRCLFPVIEPTQSAESGEWAALALTEFNALRRATEPAGAHPLIRSESVFQKNLDADIRIVATSTGAGGSLRFEVTEPGGFIASGSGSASPTGGRVTAAGGIREYMIRRAVPGIYQISCASDHPATVRVVIHTDWGRPNRKTRVVTLMLETGRLLQAGEINFEFRAED